MQMRSKATCQQGKEKSGVGALPGLGTIGGFGGFAGSFAGFLGFEGTG